MSDLEFYEDGFDHFSELLERFANKTNEANVTKVLEIGAKEFVKDVRALPKPRSETRKAGYTHLLDTVTYKVEKDEVETGWGKYYGPMVESGTTKMAGTPHMKPTFKRNQERYYKKMLNALYD